MGDPRIIKQTLVVDLEWLIPEGMADRSEDDLANDTLQLVTEYLTEEENPFRDDYGPDAWGGYEGPFVINVNVNLKEDS